MHFSRTALILLLSLITCYARAQEQAPRYDSVSRLVQAAYNSTNPANMYLLTAPVYRDRMNATRFEEGTRRFYAKAGKWIGMTEKERSDSGRVYTASFEKLEQLFVLQLDANSEIVRFDFKPVPVEKGTKKERVQSNNPMRSETDSLVEKLVRPYIQQIQTAGLTIAILKNGKLHRYSYGEVRRGGGLPDPQTTLFEIGSVTKTFTSLLLATEVVKKKMRLDDPVNRYLPGSVPTLHYQQRSISLRDLANHTSGFPRLPANIFYGNVDPADPYRHYNEDSLIRFLQSYQPAVLPGTRFSYSNVGAGLLGTILARQANLTFDQLVVERICRPLKMNHTRVELRQEDSLHIAQGYNEKGEATALWNLAALQGSGAIRSTLNDMVRYVQAQMGTLHSSLDKAILRASQITFTSPDQTMALGWRVKQDGQQTYWHHSGGTGGFRSFAGFDKQRQVGVVILSNAAEEVTAIGQALLEDKK
jgi:CubicO group peptidase (beta-lactamase class C family)